MAKKILSIFGDEFFPRIGAGSSPTKRQVAADNLMEFLRSLSPELVYIVPTARTCAYAAMVCKLMKIPFILVCPYPGYFDALNFNDKCLIESVLDEAKSLIILNEEPVDDGQEEAMKFLSTVGEALVFFYNSDFDGDFQEFITAQVNEHIGKKLLMELPYNERKVFD